MGSKKVKDLAVKTGSYESNGETKGRYVNVGAMFKNDDGGFYLRLNRTFNPAGVPCDADADSIIVGVFDLRDASSEQRPAPQPQRQAPTQRQQAAPAQNYADDDIPF